MLKKHLVVLILSACMLSTKLSYAQSWVSIGSPGFSAAQADYGTIAIDSSGTPYVAYLDESTPLYQATVMKYNGTNWVPVGRPGFTAGQVQYTSITIDRSGVPYVAYMDVNTANFRASVMKFADTGWVVVGDTGFSQQQASFTSIAIDTTGKAICVAYLDDFGCLGLPTVMKYNGTSWVNVGAPRFDTANVAYLSLAISGGVPYVAFPDGYDTQKATVMKFVDTSWVPVGSRGFSAQGVGMVSLAMNNDTPYVAFTDNANSRKATVMKYNGSSWINVGMAGFSAGEADNITIAIDKNGTPYVIFEDATTAHLGATVMKYNGSSWVTVGTPGFTTGLDAQNTTIAIDKSGNPYVCFQQFPGGKISVMKFDIATEVTNAANTVGYSVSVYPNPAHEQLTITTNDNSNITSIEITNMIGQTICTHEYRSQQVHVDISDLPKGVYFIKVNGSEVRKFVKE